MGEGNITHLIATGQVTAWDRVVKSVVGESLLPAEDGQVGVSLLRTHATVYFSRQGDDVAVSATVGERHVDIHAVPTLMSSSLTFTNNQGQLGGISAKLESSHLLRFLIREEKIAPTRRPRHTES